MSLIMRYMATADIHQVVTIDKSSFDPPWPARSYSYEINESTYSHMVVLEQQSLRPLQGWRRWLNNLRGNGNVSHEERLIVGYGGLWNIGDEAHISTIASHPEHRGSGYGEIVLAGMIGRSIRLQAAYIVLEVRVSNTVAQNLYKKYGFETVGIKRGYYSNNKENAYDMRLRLDDPGSISRFYSLYGELQKRHDIQDIYSNTPHPRHLR